MTEENRETSILFCKRCGLRTRHERAEWTERPLLLTWVTGREKSVEGWVCTKCGRRKAVQVRYLPQNREID